MFRTMRFAFAGALFAVSVAAFADPVRGTISKVDGSVLMLKSSDGADLKLTLTADAMIVAVIKASMADIKEGTFLGSAAVPQPDGTQKAVEVHIFPEQMRGTGEGHRLFAPLPGGTMTNGSTAGPMVSSVEGSTIVVKYSGGEKKIIVPPGVPIVRYEVGSPVDLKPGARFTVLNAAKKADGTFEANRINVGRGGLVPQ